MYIMGKAAELAWISSSSDFSVSYFIFWFTIIILLQTQIIVHLNYQVQSFSLSYRFGSWGTDKKNENLRITFQNCWAQDSEQGNLTSEVIFSHSRGSWLWGNAKLLRQLQPSTWLTCVLMLLIVLAWNCYGLRNPGKIYITEEFFILENNSTDNSYKQRVLRQILLHRNKDSHHRHKFSRWKWRIVLNLLYIKHTVCGGKFYNFSNIFMEWKHHFLLVKGNFLELIKNNVLFLSPVFS